MFKFITKCFKSPKIKPTRAEQIENAQNYLRSFLQDTFNPTNNERNEMEPRQRIFNNGLILINRMMHHNTTDEDFNAWYNEIINIGHRAHTGHPLYRDIDLYPHPNNTFLGMLNRIFATAYTIERRADTTVIHDQEDQDITATDDQEDQDATATHDQEDRYFISHLQASSISDSTIGSGIDTTI